MEENAITTNVMRVLERDGLGEASPAVKLPGQRSDMGQPMRQGARVHEVLIRAWCSAKFIIFPVKSHFPHYICDGI
jgi:hypothetical protein